MDPDQTAPKWEQSDLGPYCLQYRLPKYTSIQVSRQQSYNWREKSLKIIWAK